MKSAVKAVVLDIGNVLIEWQPERFYDEVIGVERRKALFEAVDLHEMNEQIDLGGAFQGTIYDTAEANPEWRDEIRMWYDRWIEMAQPVIEHTVHLMRALSQRGVPVYALSNFGVDSFSYAESKYPFLAEFDRRFISGHLGMTKPNPLIYKTVEKESNLPPKALFFADDRADNIAAARKRGWQTHLFEGPSGLADELVSRGILTGAEAAL
ncbi:MAG: HAD family phosphatase [Pseudomonadota bacterium]